MNEKPEPNPVPTASRRVTVDSTIQEFWQQLQHEYTDLQEECSPEEEVGVTALLFSGQEIHVDTFDCKYPNLLIVKGKLKDQEVQAYVSQSSVQIIFQKVKKQTEKPRNPIGFIPRLEA